MRKWIINESLGFMVELKGSVIIRLKTTRKGKVICGYIDVDGLCVGSYESYARCKQVYKDIMYFMEDPYMFFNIPKE